MLARRSPLVILICLELMLNGGNLALVAFARMTGTADGQVFALIVMIVAAAEVVVGLGLIVAMFRDRLPMDVDEMSELQGMSATTYGWLVLAFPLAGSIVIALGWRSLPGRTAGWIGSAAIGLAFLSAIAALVQLQDEPAERAAPHVVAVGLRRHRGRRREARHPRRPAGGVHGAGRVRRQLPDPRLLGRLHGAPTAATRATSATSTSSSSRCCCWCWRATS